MVKKDSESSCCSNGSHDHEDHTLSNDAVVTKYQVAAEITNAVLKEVIANIKEGAVVGDLCDIGDKMISERTGKLYKKEKNFTKVVLKNGQVVKIDLGVHIDGFIATAAHTVVVGASKDNKVTGKIADLLRGTYDGLEIAIRSLRPEASNTDVTRNIDKTASEFGLTPIENMLSHQLERNEIEGEKKIIQNSGEKQKGEVEKVTIDKHEAYAIDILFSTGKGQPKDMDTRTTVYKKNESVSYQLKMKASRVFFSDVNKQHGPMPFSLRSFEEEVKAKMGVVECEKYGLLTPYPVLYEKEGDFVAQFKATVLVMPNGLLKIAGLPFDSDVYQSERSVQDADLQTVLKSALKPKKKKEAKKEEPAAKKA
ncbi:Protein CBG01630 [Caenorhabditis briggsae]|uniref:Protein CBG01630 n=1 Tax=Caenorhabditis briggsae TaxID=6238 RepID=A8WR75_CAEBR|nr:Protein CBG01630 [Caenorhabditis briggsae]CAP22983.2 Protein CBG01630 [Caenorhabditis briggsae]